MSRDYFFMLKLFFNISIYTALVLAGARLTVHIYKTIYETVEKTLAAEYGTAQTAYDQAAAEN